MRILLMNNQDFLDRDLIDTLEIFPDIEIVEKTGGCAETIRYALDFAPDYVLINIDSRQSDGAYEVWEILDQAPQMRVIALSLNESEDALLDVATYGGKGFLNKVTRAEDLVNALRSFKDGEFILSPKLTWVMLSNYSRMRSTIYHHFDLEHLTSREREIFYQLGNGASNSAIAERLVISKNTVRIHVQNIFRKLGLRNRREAREKFRLVLRHQSQSE